MSKKYISDMPCSFRKEQFNPEYTELEARVVHMRGLFMCHDVHFKYKPAGERVEVTRVSVMHLPRIGETVWLFGRAYEVVNVEHEIEDSRMETFITLDK